MFVENLSLMFAINRDPLKQPSKPFVSPMDILCSINVTTFSAINLKCVKLEMLISFAQIKPPTKYQLTSHNLVMSTFG